MKKITYALASSAAVMALLVATPVLAHSDNRGPSLDGDGHFGIGVLTRLFDDNRDRRDGDREDNRGPGRAARVDDDRDREEREDKVTIAGTITAINGSQISVISVLRANGTAVTVDASDATLSGNGNVDVTLADLRVGDRLVVRGELDDGVIEADTIRDVSLAQRIFVSAIGAAGAGVVTSISGNTFTINPIGNGTLTSVTTNASTTFKVNGQATTSDALAVGSNVIVTGTSTSDTSISASIVHILNLSLDFLRHFFLFR